jgi:hypothetical protein
MPWRRDCARRMPSLCAVVKSCSPALMATTPTSSPASSAVIRKPRATPSTGFGRGGARRGARRRSNHPHTVHRPFDAEGTEALCARCSTGAPESSASKMQLVDDGDGRRGEFRRGTPKGAHQRETIRATVAQLLRVRWQRAKRLITSPDPLYGKKEGATD